MAPNITDFDAGPLAIHPSETGVESFAAAGRRAGAFYNQAAESTARLGTEIGSAVARAGDTAVAYMDHQQINAGADHASKMWANLQDSWNQTQVGADPHDPTVAQKWRDEVLEPTLNQFSQGFTTEKAQDWANGRVNNLRQHFFQTTEADMSHNAKVAVEATLRNMHNNYTSALLKDPTGLPGVIDQIDHSTEGVLAANPNIKGPDAAEVRLGASEKLKEAAVKAAVQGSILNGGNWQSIANKYPNYVDASEMKMFERAARTYDRMAAADARSARVQQDYINKQDFNTAANKLEVETIPQKPGDPPVLPKDYWDRVKQIGLMPGVEPARLQSLISNGEKLTDKLGKPEPLAPISHATTVQAMNDLRAGKSVDIAALYGDNKLNNADYGFLAKAIEERKTPEGERLDKDRDLFFKRYSMMIDPTMGEHGDRLYNAEMQARQAEQDAIKHGDDPHLVYQPGSKYFIGTPEQINKWKQPLQADIQPPATAAPERPKGFPTDAQWDAARKYWYVMQDGKKFRVEPTSGQPAWPTIPSSQ